MNMALCEWYADREILLTGVTSELGRTLLEKILRSFRNVKVYAVIRSRNGLSKDDRIKKIFMSARYERLRQQDPDAISRVKAIEGNFLYDGLGMSKDDKLSLKNISVAIHAGGPHEATFEYSQELPRLEVLVAISSIFKHKGQIKESSQNERIPEGPVALVRIPFVGPAYREPMPGFVETLKGPTALIIGAGLALGRSEIQAEVIPIDLAVNTLIAAAWERAIDKGNVKTAVVYNAATLNCTWGELIKKGRRGRKKFPYPGFGIHGMISTPWVHWILVLLLEWLPAMVCDTILSLFGAKQRILQEHVRVRNALRSLESISSRPWSAERNRVNLLQKRLSPEEAESFSVIMDVDLETYGLCTAAAARKNCTDESYVRIMKMFQRAFFIVLIGVLLYTFFFKSFTAEKHGTKAVGI